MTAGTFAGLEGLMSLDLHGNRLAGLAPESFKELTGLRSLDMSENKLVT